MDFYAIPPSLPSTVYTIVHIHSSYKCLVRKIIKKVSGGTARPRAPRASAGCGAAGGAPCVRAARAAAPGPLPGGGADVLNSGNRNDVPRVAWSKTCKLGGPGARYDCRTPAKGRSRDETPESPPPPAVVSQTRPVELLEVSTCSKRVRGYKTCYLGTNR